MCIILHNYSHLLSGMPHENEYTFDINNAKSFFEMISTPSWDLPLQLLSFFGHYGVPVFLFLSAYGLVAKYESGTSKENIGTFRFIKYHYLKLLRLMFIGFIICCSIEVANGSAGGFTIPAAISELLMMADVTTAFNWQIIPMPYWFLGMLFEMYIVYRLLLYKRSSWIAIALAIVCILPQLFFGPTSGKLCYWHLNFAGNFLPFVLGLLAARYKDRISNLTKSWGLPAYSLIFLVSLAGLFAFSLNYVLWMFASVCVVIAAISFVRLLRGSLLNAAVWVGTISASLYVIHPAIREFTLTIGDSVNPYVGWLVYLAVTFIAALLYAQIIKLIPKPKL